MSFVNYCYIELDTNKKIQMRCLYNSQYYLQFSLVLMLMSLTIISQPQFQLINEDTKTERRVETVRDARVAKLDNFKSQLFLSSTSIKCFRD